MGLWFIVTWMVSLNKVEEHEIVVNQMLKKMKEITPEKQFKYFNQRFHGPRRKVLLISGIDDLTDYDQWQKDVSADEECSELVRAWHSCKVEGTTQNQHWSENTLE